LWHETQGQLLGLQGRLYALDSAFAAGGITAEFYANQIARLNVESAATLNELGYGDNLTVVVEALGKVLGDFKTIESSIANILGSGLSDWADGIADGLARAVIQGESLRDAIAQTAQNIATEMLSALIKVGIQMAVNRLLASQIRTDTLATSVAAASSAAAAFNPSAAFTSLFGGFAEGGHVLGPGTTTSDSIRAWLSNNEFVTRAAVVTQPGALDFLHDFNSRGMAALREWSAVHHATGGLAGVPAPSFPAPAVDLDLAPPAGARVDNNFRFVNVFDVEDVSRRVAATATFERQVLNIVSSNPTAVRERLGL
jgi:hypothetical protein